MKHVIIIGAGASGLMSAITAARNGAKVTVLEGMDKPGKKILMTGNGRCNLTNTDQSHPDRYAGANADFRETVLSLFSVEDTMHFFEELGLVLQNKEGYIYPYVNQAGAVLDLLLLECSRLGVKLKCLEKVENIQYSDSCWKVSTNSWAYEGDAVILAAGSKAAPVSGSDGSGYALAAKLEHPIIEPLEALVPLKIREKEFGKLAGVRMPARLELRIDDEQYTSEGELQWTEYGISGIVTFQISRYAVRAIYENKKPVIIADLYPSLSREQLTALLLSRLAAPSMQNCSMELFLTGILPKKCIPVILKKCGIANMKTSKIEKTHISELVDLVKHLTLHITGSKSFDMAQVCSGGIDTAHVDKNTMESLILPGLYFAGEILDVDGICGGYNLQWAWSSGYMAGLYAAKSEVII